MPVATPSVRSNFGSDDLLLNLSPTCTFLQKRLRSFPRRARDVVRKCARAGGPAAHGRGRCCTMDKLGQCTLCALTLGIEGAQVTTKLSFQKVGRLCVWARKLRRVGEMERDSLVVDLNSDHHHHHQLNSKDPFHIPLAYSFVFWGQFFNLTKSTPWST